MLTTLLKPTAGRARVAGYDVVAEAPMVRRSIGVALQDAAIDPLMTGTELMRLQAVLHGIPRTTAERRSGELLERVGLTGAAHRRVGTYSGGMRRRLDLAMSLIHEPIVLFLDEPTTGLDPRSRQVVWSTIRELVGEGVTLLLTTQYLEEADELADSVVLIDHGRAAAAGTPAQLKAQIGDQRVDVVATDGSGLDRLVSALDPAFDLTVARDRRMISIPAPSEASDLRAVADVVAATGVPVDELALRRPTLDDAFLALTGQPPTTDQTVDEPLEVSV
jgi:ABC-2 type transport system ATP-binding protein